MKVRQVSEPWKAASAIAPTTPKAAASVAVASPAYIEPITKAMRATTGTRNTERRTRSAIEQGGSGGGASFRMTRDQIAT